MSAIQALTVLIGIGALTPSALISSTEAIDVTEHSASSPLSLRNVSLDENLVELVDGPWLSSDQADLRSDLETDPPEVQFLVQRYGLTSEEAWRRLEVSETLGLFARILDKEFGNDYGGAWLDHHDGGKIYVGARDEDISRVRALAQEFGVENLVTETRQATIGDLEALQLRLAQRLSGAPNLEVGGVHAPSGTVDLLVVNSPALGLEEFRSARSTANELAREFGDGVRIREVTGSVETAACAPKGENRIWCDPPLRGGVGITGDAVPCSGGFNTRSRTYGIYYFLTAGHCGAANRWDTRDADLTVYQVGPTHSLEWNEVSDSMIIRVLVPTFWDPAPWVFVTGDDGQAYNQSRIMREVGTTTEGMPICMTGRMGGTECGEVIRRSTPGIRITDAAEVEGGCIRGGDSGGSVYSGTTAYGIVHGGRFVNGDNSTCSLSWFYQGITEALERRNVRLIVGS
jgi:hypothetical protein